MVQRFIVRLGSRGCNADMVRAIESGAFPYPIRFRTWWHQRVRLRDFTPAAATSQALNLNTLFPKNEFPPNVDLLEGHQIKIIALGAGSGITGITVRLGDTNDNDGLLTASNVLGGGAAVGDILQTPAAAEYGNRPESNFVPLLTVATVGGGNISAFTQFDVEALICWTQRTEV